MTDIAFTDQITIGIAFQLQDNKVSPVIGDDDRWGGQAPLVEEQGGGGNMAHEGDAFDVLAAVKRKRGRGRG